MVDFNDHFLSAPNSFFQCISNILRMCYLMLQGLVHLQQPRILLLQLLSCELQIRLPLQLMLASKDPVFYKANLLIHEASEFERVSAFKRRASTRAREGKLSLGLFLTEKQCIAALLQSCLGGPSCLHLLQKIVRTQIGVGRRNCGGAGRMAKLDLFRASHVQKDPMIRCIVIKLCVPQDLLRAPFLYK